MKFIRLSVVISFLFLNIGLLRAQTTEQLISPDGKLVFSFRLNDSGTPVYSINYKQQPFILPSAIGVSGWEKELALSGVVVSEKDTTWKPVYGERRSVRDHYKEMQLTLHRKKQPGEKICIQVRAYNAGIAFRYSFATSTQGAEREEAIHIQKELTEFTLPDNTKAWFAAHAQSAYSLLPLKNWPGEAERPLVLQLADGRYGCWQKRHWWIMPERSLRWTQPKKIPSVRL